MEWFLKVLLFFVVIAVTLSKTKKKGREGAQEDYC